GLAGVPRNRCSAGDFKRGQCISATDCRLSVVLQTVDEVFDLCHVRGFEAANEERNAIRLESRTSEHACSASAATAGSPIETAPSEPSNFRSNVVAISALRLTSTLPIAPFAKCKLMTALSMSPTLASASEARLTPS